jgi:hypothetical protein
MATTMNVKLLQVVKTSAEWHSLSTQASPVIPSKGLICVEMPTVSSAESATVYTRIKIGDGYHTYGDLHYVDEDYIDSRIEALGHFMEFKGVVATQSELDNVPNPKAGDVWLVGPEGNPADYNEYVYYTDSTGETPVSGWVPLGPIGVSVTEYTNGTGLSLTDGTEGKKVFSLNAAQSGIIGGVKVAPNSGLTLGNDGALSVAVATDSVLGGVTIATTSSISNTSGAIDVALTEKGGLEKDSTTGSIGVKVDGTSIVKSSTDGTLGLKHTAVTAVTTETLAKFTCDVNGLITGSTPVADSSIVSDVKYDTTSHKIQQKMLNGSTYSDVATADTTVTASSDNLVTSGAVSTAITTAIDALDVDNITGFGAGKTLETLTENNGIINATFQDISITSSQISDKNTHLVQGVSINGTEAQLDSNGKVAFTGIAKGVNVTNGSGTTTAINADPSTGMIDLTSLTLQCVLE